MTLAARSRILTARSRSKVYLDPEAPVPLGSGQVSPGHGLKALMGKAAMIGEAGLATKSALTGEAAIAPPTIQASTQTVRKTLVFVCSIEIISLI